MNDPASNSPYVIGVVGHRDWESHDLAQVRDAVARFFGEIRSRLPDMELKIMLGSDSGEIRTAAETALELGLRADAVLSMPPVEYAATGVLMHQSHVMLVLWDGQGLDRPAGTADTLISESVIRAMYQHWREAMDL